MKYALNWSDANHKGLTDVLLPKTKPDDPLEDLCHSASRALEKAIKSRQVSSTIKSIEEATGQDLTGKIPVWAKLEGALFSLDKYLPKKATE